MSGRNNRAESLVTQVRRYCQQFQLFPSNLDEEIKVVVAVSGGTDSLTLLHCLLALREEFHLSLHVATLDHGLRVPQGADDAAFVETIAAQWDLPISVRSVDITKIANMQPNESARGIEALAREVRYQFLRDVAHEIGATLLAIGHNQNDQAETVLMHLMRGSGTAGLRGILPKSHLYLDQQITVIRPLLNIPRRVIDDYVAQYLQPVGIVPRYDHTNDDPHYTRNHIRQRILPLISAINDNIEGTLARTAEIAQDEYEALRSQLPSFQAENGNLLISRDTFLQLSIAIQRLTVREMLHQFKVETIDFGLVQRVVDDINQHNIIVRRRIINELNGNDSLWLSITNGTIAFYSRENERQYPEYCPMLLETVTLPLQPAIVTLPHTNWQVRIEPVQTFIPGNNPLQVVLSITNEAIIKLRTRQSGDRFKPQGMAGKSRKLQDVFVDMKVPLMWRDQAPLLVINGEIAWFAAPTETMVRCRISETYAVTTETVQDATYSIWMFTFFNNN